MHHSQCFLHDIDLCLIYCMCYLPQNHCSLCADHPDVLLLPQSSQAQLSLQVRLAGVHRPGDQSAEPGVQRPRVHSLGRVRPEESQADRLQQTHGDQRRTPLTPVRLQVHGMQVLLTDRHSPEETRQATRGLDSRLNRILVFHSHPILGSVFYPMPLKPEY